MKKGLGIFNRKTRRRRPAKRQENYRRDDYYRNDDADYADEDYSEEDYADDDYADEDYEDEDYADDADYGDDNADEGYSDEGNSDEEEPFIETESWNAEDVDDYADTAAWDKDDVDEAMEREDVASDNASNIIHVAAFERSREAIEENEAESSENDDLSEDDSYSDDEYYEDEDYPDEDDNYRANSDDVEDLDREYDEDDDDDDYRDDEFEREYGGDDEGYADEDDDYPEDEEFDREYDEEDYPDEDDRYYEDDEDDRYAAAYGAGRGSREAGRSSRGSHSGRDNRSGRSSRRHSGPNPLAVAGGKIVDFFKNTGAVERIAMFVAVLLVAGGIVMANYYSKAMDRKNEIDSFVEIGQSLNETTVVGQSGLIAMADAQKAKALAAGLVAEEELTEEQIEEEVVEENKTINIKVTLTSIKSDMKVKFINSETKKLISNVHFEIDVVTPDGTKITYDDHDKDGIIYKKDITAGKYKITPRALGSEYENYKLDTSTQTLTVKDQVEMKAVDVSDEIKKESQINAAVEDTAEKTVVESQLTDTVEWVESNQNTSSGSQEKYKYEEINRNDIPAPYTTGKAATGTNIYTAARTKVVANRTYLGRTEGGSDNTGEGSSGGNTGESGSGNTGESGSGNTGDGSGSGNTGEGGGTDSGSGGNTGGSGDGSGSGNTGEGGGTDSGSGGNTGSGSGSGAGEGGTTPPVEEIKDMQVSPSSITIKEGEEATITVTGPSSPSFKSSNEAVATVSGGKVKAVKAGDATITITADKYKDATVSVHVDTAAVEKKTFKITKAELALKIGDKEKIALTEAPSKVKYESSDAKIATVAEDGTVTAVAAGTATITLKADDYNDGKVTVKVAEGDKLKMELNATKLTLKVGGSSKITAKGPEKITFKSSKDSVATVDKDGKVTGVGAGSATITVSADKYADATVEVVVESNKTVLKDKNGNIVYVKNDDGSWREATYDDYYGKKTLYLRKENKENTGTRYGWWTINGNTYYYDKNGNYVTGEQVIQGAKYSFNGDGVLSSSSGVMGIDVSKWNGSINWAQVKNSGVNFVIIRCGYRGSSAGALIEDPKFRSNIQGATAAGLKVGVYFFTQAVNEVEAVEEASMAISLVRGYGLSYPIYLDVEGSGGRGDKISASQRTANIKAFCGTVQNAGYRAGVYANKTWFTSHINTGSLTNYKIWLAQYAASVTYNATRYDMWQYTSKGKISGISGNVDMNISYN
ncbi:GH25 family lysozyme [Butyrivibrio sp. FCS014]|uniref:GH25 family lysozyme n=1 Tax=Butyrivibrio sp. FCS014 TaxID=1408304 RepID=UPI0004BC6C8D|nr:GH25 family lysozyme [Butyrivibrio sp. FCS014]